MFCSEKNFADQNTNFKKRMKIQKHNLWLVNIYN